MLYVFEKGERLRSGCFPSSAQGLFALLRRRSWVSKGRRRAMAISRSLMSQRIGCGGELKCAHTRERERERESEIEREKTAGGWIWSRRKSPGSMNVLSRALGAVRCRCDGGEDDVAGVDGWWSWEGFVFMGAGGWLLRK
jgi:hypothetical protein